MNLASSEVIPSTNLGSVEVAATTIRDYEYDISQRVHQIVDYLRGSSKAECGGVSMRADPMGKIAEIMSIQESTISSQRDTLQLLSQLCELLNVSA